MTKKHGAEGGGNSYEPRVAAAKQQVALTIAGQGTVGLGLLKIVSRFMASSV